MSKPKASISIDKEEVITITIRLPKSIFDVKRKKVKKNEQ